VVIRQSVVEFCAKRLRRWTRKGKSLLQSYHEKHVSLYYSRSIFPHSLVRQIPRPGRRTHAEHAIGFYRHALALNEGEIDETSEEEEVEEAPAAAKKEEEPKESKEPSKPIRKTRGRPKRKSNDDEGSKAGSVTSLDSDEFRNQHNDLCEVCNDGGELVCCSTCNLVFHLACIRPPTSRFPPDKWCCAYCVAAGVKGHAKEARTRRRMAAAAREMTRMKNELNGEATDNEEKKDSTQMKRRGRPRKRIVEAEESDEPEKEEPALKKRRGRPPKRLVEANEADEPEQEAPSQAEEDTGDARNRRERRQPALYNPQAGAASAWQSDGKLEWKSLGDEQGGSTEEDTDGKETDEETVLCNFCHDDPAVSVCCFCACRTCFGKHDKVSCS